MKQKAFRPWEVDQAWLFPPTVRDFVPDDHLANFVRETVRNDLDLGAIFAHYSARNGHPAYHPAMMVSLLLYSLCRGVYSSRRIERSCSERVDFMAVTGMSKPDHSTICSFRDTHRVALCQLFVQVLALCRDAGIAKMGHVSLDGTKIRANASKHKAMSYKRMQKAEPELAAIVAAWMAESEAADARENAEHGAGGGGDEIPAHIVAKVRQLAKIRAAQARLEAAAQAKAERIAAARAAKEAALGHPLGGSEPKALDGVPEDKAQSNFTDPESRIMKTQDGFQQCYNAQAAVDAESQVIVAATLTNRSNDLDQLEPSVKEIEAHAGEAPRELSADAGYCSEDNLAVLDDHGIRGYVATGRQKHGTASATGEKEPKGEKTRAMRARRRQGGWRSRYRLRKQTVEPVFGQIKECRNFRRFLHRGLKKVSAEWTMLCTAHNLLKLAAARA